MFFTPPPDCISAIPASQLGEQLGAVPVGGALAAKQQAKVRPRIRVILSCSPL
jgi:hypothetical protein